MKKDVKDLAHQILREFESADAHTRRLLEERIFALELLAVRCRWEDLADELRQWREMNEAAS